MTQTTKRFVMWAAAAVVAVGAATGAVAAVSSGRGSNVLSQGDVASALAADSARGDQNDDTTGPASTPTPGATMSPGGETITGDNGVFRAAKGGTVVVACDGDLARLVSWSPAQGYRADHAVRGPAARASILFESDTANDVTVVVTCAGGTPTVQQLIDVDDHGGGGGGGGGGSGRG
jgi:hypothetical protein